MNRYRIQAVPPSPPHGEDESRREPHLREENATDIQGADIEADETTAAGNEGAAVAQSEGPATEEAVLKVGFPAAAAFNKRKAEATEARDRFAEAVRAIVGERLRPVFVLLEGDEGEEHAGRAMSDEELVEAVKSAFDAEEVSVDDEPEERTKEAAG